MRHKHPLRCTATIAISYQKPGKEDVVGENHIESKIGKVFALDKCMTKPEGKRFQKRGLGVDFGMGLTIKRPTGTWAAR